MCILTTHLHSVFNKIQWLYKECRTHATIDINDNHNDVIRQYNDKQARAPLFCTGTINQLFKLKKIDYLRHVELRKRHKFEVNPLKSSKTKRFSDWRQTNVELYKIVKRITLKNDSKV